MKNQKLTQQELDVIKTILIYLNKIEDENSILKGNLLKKEEKQFIFDNLNAFVIGLIADQSVKAEIAWSLPYKLYQRIGSFDFKEILNNYTESDIENIIREKPSLHRYPSKMANYIYNAMQEIVSKYNSNVSNIWLNKSAAEIVESLEKFKGISHKKASLGTLILTRDLDVDILDKENIDIAYDIHIRRLFVRIGLVNEDSQENILNEAKKLYPEFPGKLTTAFWTLGREICRSCNPSCLVCPLYNYCDKNIDKSNHIKK